MHVPKVMSTQIEESSSSVKPHLRVLSKVSIMSIYTPVRSKINGRRSLANPQKGRSAFMQVACGRCCRQPDQSVKALQNPPVDQRLRTLYHISPEAISQPLQMFGSTLRPIISAKLSGPTAKEPSNVSERAAIRDKAFQPLIMYQES